MISVTRLYCGTPTSGDRLRYTDWQERRPVVVWNATRRCNLRCVHCYSDSENKAYDGELTTEQARGVIDDLAAFGVPVMLFSGGEPLVRDDILGLAAYAGSLGVRPVLSTNGTLIDARKAGQLRESGFAYVGISLDGIGDTNDQFRGVTGAFDAAVRGFHACLEVGQKVGLRLTLTRRNCGDLDRVFDFIEEMRIPRACFYHLVYAGRGSDVREDDLTREEARGALDLIMDRTLDMHRRGVECEILTVDNHCDGPYLYMRLLREDPGRAAVALDLLRLNGGNSSGVGIGCIDNLGEVHADQFWLGHSFGNVLARRFSEIWTDTSDPIMAGLKDRKRLLTGRCADTSCRWIDICNGNFRARALAVGCEPWAEDPACYLTADEIAR